MKEPRQPQRATVVGSLRPSSELIQKALDWLFEQEEAGEYCRARGNHELVSSEHGPDADVFSPPIAEENRVTSRLERERVHPRP